MDINNLIVRLKESMPNASWRHIAKEVNRKFGTELSASAVNHRYIRSVERRVEEQTDKKHYPGQLDEVFPKRYRELTVLPPYEGNVLIIGDTHLPFELPGYLDFLLRTWDEWDCEIVFHIGDFVDNYALSQFAHDPNGYSAGSEYERTLELAQRWYAEFPEVYVCIGNHDARYIRQAIKSGIPTPFMRGYEELYGQPPGWKWGIAWELNGTVYEHGAGGGKNAALARAMDRAQSVVMGHIHTWGGVQWFSNRFGSIYGMNVGCGIDRHKYAFAYSGQSQKMPSIGCGVVLGQGRQPIFVPYDGVQ